MWSSGEVLICQPYVPEYRVPLFDALAQELHTRDLRLMVAHGMPTGVQARRGDAWQSARWSRRVPTIRVPLPGGIGITWKHLGDLAKSADVIVSELATTELTTWRQLANRAERVIVWGHGRSYVRKTRAAEAILEAVMAKRAAHVMSYMESGRQSLIARGVPASRVTAIGNTTDTARLRELREVAGVQYGERLRTSLRLPAHCALYVGGLDADKRIPFLLDAARHAYEVDSDFALIIGGSGTDESAVEAVAGEAWIRWLPRVDPEAFVGLATLVESIWMPGRIGLVAVDALALGLPMLTTRFRYHAPEYEYLREGVDVFVLPDDPQHFAESAALHSAGWRTHPRAFGQTHVPDVRQVAVRIADVVSLVLNRTRA